MVNVEKAIANYRKEHPVNVGYIGYSSLVKHSSYGEILGYILLIVIFIILLLSLLYWIFFQWDDFFIKFVVPISIIIIPFAITYKIKDLNNFIKENELFFIIFFQLILIHMIYLFFSNRDNKF